jgi:tRNA(Ile)-lysidine synthase
MGADFRHIEKLRRLAAEKCGLQPRRLQLPGGEAILRDGELVISPNEAKKSPSASAPESYEYALAVPGELMLPELGISLRARLATGAEANGKSAHAGYNLPLAAAKIGAGLRIRNWRAGERFWPLGRRAPKKIKELLQKIPAERRKLWPVAATASGELVWMLGFPPATSWAERQANAPGIVIEEANESRKKLTRAS